MRLAGICLLAICVVLAAGSAAGSLARAAFMISGDRSQAPRPAETPSPSFFVYLPLVTRELAEGAWVTIVEEGFETPPGDLWDFRDANGGAGGAYTWARRDCRPNTGSYSAWAVGGGADGMLLPCGSDYPAGVDSWMAYGPFSLADATAASLDLRLWLFRGDAFDRDEFCWSAGSSSAELLSNQSCLTYDTGVWSPLTFDLGDPDAINMLGKPQVWIAFRFASYGIGSQAEGAYVDDVVIRKCVGGTCPPVSGSVSALAAGRVERSRGLRAAARASSSRVGTNAKR